MVRTVVSDPEKRTGGFQAVVSQRAGAYTPTYGQSAASEKIELKIRRDSDQARVSCLP